MALAAARSRPIRTTKVDLHDPDVLLMERVRGDDEAAFAELLRRYWGRIFDHFYRRLGDRQEAEDLTQEVFLRLYRSRKRYQPRAKVVTWLFHVAGNVARNALRTRRRRPWIRFSNLHHRDELPDLEGLLTDRGEAPTRPLERAEVAGMVRTAVAGLVGRQRTALELHQFQNRTYAEIAQAMDMTPKAAKSLLYRARLQLRANLTPVLGPEAGLP